MVRKRIFIDSSVLIASLLSSTGGSYHIIQSFKNTVEFIINEYVFAEVMEVLRIKFASRELERQLFLRLGLSKVKIERNPTLDEVDPWIQYVGAKDAPVLAGAVKCKAHYLLTLDKRFRASGQPHVSFAINAPKEFLQQQPPK